jgi:hypothetical protein
MYLLYRQNEFAYISGRLSYLSLLDGDGWCVCIALLQTGFLFNVYDKPTRHAFGLNCGATSLGLTTL